MNASRTAYRRSSGPTAATQRVLLVFSMFVIAAFAGCAAIDGHPRRPTDPKKDLEQLESQINAASVTACVKAPTFECRNALVGARMYATDILFSEFEETLFRDTRTTGFAATLR